MAIKYDSRGFIIGDRRLKEMSEGIVKTQDNTKEILAVLKSSLDELKTTMQDSNQVYTSELERQNRQGKSVNAAETVTTARQAVDASKDAVEVAKKALEVAEGRVARKSGQGSGNGVGSGISSAKERTEQARERDSKGRFIGSGDKETNSFFGKLKKVKEFFTGSVGGAGVDTSGVDPTLDAMREVKDVVAPVGRVFGGMGARAIGIFRGRMKKRSNEEQIPEEQVKANKAQQKSNKNQEKLLVRLIRAVNAGNGGLFGRGGLGGLGGGLLKTLGRGGKGLLRKIPILGALFGGAVLAKDWGKMDTKDKGKGIGSIVGTAVGGVLGSFFGPVGTVGGAVLGDKLGGIFGEKVGSWVDELKKVDLKQVLKDTLKSLLDFGKNNLIPFRQAGNVAGAVGGAWDAAKGWVRDKVGTGGVSATGRFAPLLDEIAVGESGVHGYDAVYSGAKVKPSKPISQMTVAEVKAYQEQLLKSGSASTAVGRYQFIRNKGAFSKMAAQAGLKDTDIFDAKAQDKLAIHYLGGEKSLDDMMRKGDYVGLANKTAQQFASMKNASGRGSYDGDGLNLARHGGVEAMREISKEVIANSNTPAKPAAAKAPAKPMATKAPAKDILIFPTGANRPAPINVPKITPELTKIGRHTTAQAKSAAPSDSTIGQTVADRSLAHVMSGGIGYDSYSA
ncbi:hypothetical protein WCE14_09170 [Acinetobacter schindleri]|uniref:hypothetical protein n=1 Tax=Acinetobacter schindleri TaxID=108981 RepID=UPI0034D538D8